MQRLYHETNRTLPRPTKVRIPTQPKEGWMGHPIVHSLIKVLAWATRLKEAWVGHPNDGCLGHPPVVLEFLGPR